MLSNISRARPHMLALIVWWLESGLRPEDILRHLNTNTLPSEIPPHLRYALSPLNMLPTYNAMFYPELRRALDFATA